MSTSNGRIPTETEEERDLRLDAERNADRERRLSEQDERAEDPLLKFERVWPPHLRNERAS